MAWDANSKQTKAISTSPPGTRGAVNKNLGGFPSWETVIVVDSDSGASLARPREDVQPPVVLGGTVPAPRQLPQIPTVKRHVVTVYEKAFVGCEPLATVPRPPVFTFVFPKG
jgi:hypothetical protein